MLQNGSKIINKGKSMSLKYRTFLQNKLWRNKMPRYHESNGSKIDCRLLTNKEFDEQLRIKIKEEAQEVALASTKEQLIEEFADVCEVIEALSLLHGISWQDISEKQLQKREKAGTFTQDSFVLRSHHIEGSVGAQYFLNDPLKYPEVVNE